MFIGGETISLCPITVVGLCVTPPKRYTGTCTPACKLSLVETEKCPEKAKRTVKRTQVDVRLSCLFFVDCGTLLRDTSAFMVWRCFWGKMVPIGFCLFSLVVLRYDMLNVAGNSCCVSTDAFDLTAYKHDSYSQSRTVGNWGYFSAIFYGRLAQSLAPPKIKWKRNRWKEKYFKLRLYIAKVFREICLFSLDLTLCECVSVEWTCMWTLHNSVRASVIGSHCTLFTLCFRLRETCSDKMWSKKKTVLATYYFVINVFITQSHALKYQIYNINNLLHLF